MPKLSLEIKNYKGIDELEFPLEDYNVISVKGPNRGGKSSLINGIFENITATNLSDEPLQRGKPAGEKSIIISDKDGNNIKVVHTFDKKSPKGRFYAIQDKKKIGSVNKIRELLGETNKYTIDEFFTMCKSVPGRRKFINEILMKCIDPKKAERVKEITELTTKGGILYEKRTDANKKLEILKATPKLSDEEKEKVKGKKDVEAKIEELSGKINKTIDAINISNSLGSLSDLISDINFTELVKEKDNLKFFKNKTDLLYKYITEFVKFETGFPLNYFSSVHNAIVEAKESFEKQKSSYKEEIKNIENIEYKSKDYKDIDKKIKNAEKDIENIQKEINELYEEKNEILADSNLPEGLKIESESEFTYNNFSFNENEISESEAWLLLAQLTLPIYTAKYFRMGNASIYGKDALNKLQELAIKHNKIIALEKVEEGDLYIEGCISDNEVITSDKKEESENINELEESEHFDPENKKEEPVKEQEQKSKPKEKEEEENKSIDLNDDDISQIENLF